MSDRPHVNVVESEKKGTVHGEQRSSHLLLKPEITKLCEVLLLPVCIFLFVEFYLLYVVLLWSFDKITFNNYIVFVDEI